MVIHDNFIFVHMVKTGGTFIQDCLGKYIPGCRGTGRGHKRHHPASEVRRIGTFKFGVIRNPFSWYVSWWAFLGNQRHPGNTFPQFVTNDFNETVKNASEMTGMIKQTSSPLTIDFDLMNRFDIGIMTYKFLETFYDYNCMTSKKFYNGFYTKEILVDKFIYMENLQEELVHLFHNYIFELTDEQMEGILSMPKVNESKHNKDYRSYYNDFSREWITHKDRHIFNLFNYSWKREACGT